MSCRSWAARAIAFLVCLLVGSAASAQSNRQLQPIPSSPKQDLTAIEQLFAPPPVQKPNTMFPELRERWQDTPAFLRDSKVDFNLRSYYRDNVNNSAGSSPGNVAVQEAWASGGWVTAETGKLADLVSLGATLYTSFPIYAPAGYGNTLMLLPNQQGYAVFGELYGQAHLFDDTHRITVGRKRYNTPFIGPHDNRMTPNTFSGYSLIGTLGDEEKGGLSLRYGGGYIDAMKQRDAVTFQSMASAAGVPTSNAGIGVVGGLLKWGPASLGAMNYYGQDLLNIFYAEGRTGWEFGNGFTAIAAAQFAAQNSTGQALMNGGTPFATNELGAKVQLGYDEFILTLAYTAVNPGFALQTPWSANPFYTDALIQGFQRAGEQTGTVGVSYVLKKLGLPGIAVAAQYLNGWTSAPAAGLPLVETEWDFTLQWRPEHKAFHGLWLQTRYGKSWTWQGGNLTTVDEVRLILNYDIKLY